jgi:hypothetical protein
MTPVDAPHARRVLPARLTPSVTDLPVTRPLAGLVLVDLPVDVVVVLEQQERAGQGERGERSSRERGWSAPWEHVFVR